MIDSAYVNIHSLHRSPKYQTGGNRPSHVQNWVSPVMDWETKKARQKTRRDIAKDLLRSMRSEGHASDSHSPEIRFCKSNSSPPSSNEELQTRLSLLKTSNSDSGKNPIQWIDWLQVMCLVKTEVRFEQHAKQQSMIESQVLYWCQQPFCEQHFHNFFKERCELP